MSADVAPTGAPLVISERETVISEPGTVAIVAQRSSPIDDFQNPPLRASMSAKELELRIDKLSADIIRQKEVLKQLESSKSAAQRQLNAILDPVARLPLEISSEIFIQCLSARPGPHASDPPLLFLNICNMWTEIALSTPALWAAIHVDNPVVDLGKLLDSRFKRAGSRALSISLPQSLAGDISLVIGTHRDRLRDLSMYDDDDDIALVIDVGPFVFLQTLSITGISTDPVTHDPIRQMPSTAMGILRVSPNLVECTFNSVLHSIDDDDYAGEILVFPHMKHLKFGNSPHSYGSDLILDYISTPCLQTLHLYTDARNEGALLRFLERSSPPLQKIVLGSYVMWVEYHEHEIKE
ncbi:hypothetical protein DFH09DRAFT_1368264, partial [Mycena vulgaris]